MISVLVAVLVFAIAVPLFSWLVVSPLVFIWWFFDTATRDCFMERHEKIAGAVFLGAFFGLSIVLAKGIEGLLGFIPGDWGTYDEDGDFVTARSSIACTLAFFFSLFFVHVFEKFEKMHTKTNRLTILAEILKRKDELRHCSRQLLIEKQDKIRTDLENLRNKSYNQKLSSGEEREIQVLTELHEELEGRIKRGEEK